jgi:hypothetical protein
MSNHKKFKKAEKNSLIVLVRRSLDAQFTSVSGGFLWTVRGIAMGALALIDRSMTNYRAGVSGKRNRIIRWRPNKKRKGHLSPWPETNIYHLPPSRHLLFLIGHYSVPLSGGGIVIVETLAFTDCSIFV